MSTQFCRHCDPANPSLRASIIIIKQNKMTRFINSKGVKYVLTYCNSLDCFVPRNDGMRYRNCDPANPSLRACEVQQGGVFWIASSFLLAMTIRQVAVDTTIGTLNIEL